jgi:hypothetical protein
MQAEPAMARMIEVMMYVRFIDFFLFCSSQHKDHTRLETFYHPIGGGHAVLLSRSDLSCDDKTIQIANELALLFYMKLTFEW